MTASRVMKIALAGLLASTGVALAQQQPDPADLQKAIQTLQSQRNVALDMQVNYEVRIAKLADENAKLKGQIKELEEKATPKPPAQ